MNYSERLVRFAGASSAARARPRRERLTRVARPLRDTSSDALVKSLRPDSLASPGPFSLHAISLSAYVPGNSWYR